jgi:hypothetical protein
MGMANLSCSPILNQLDADLGSRESSPPGLGIKSLSDGIRTLIVIDEKLVQLGKEGEGTRSEVRIVIEKYSGLLARLRNLTNV